MQVTNGRFLQTGRNDGKPLGFIGVGSLADVCTQYDDHDECVAWNRGSGGGSYSGPNLNNVDAPTDPSYTGAATGNMPSVADQVAMIAQQYGAQYVATPKPTQAASGSNNLPILIAVMAGAALLFALKK